MCFYISFGRACSSSDGCFQETRARLEQQLKDKRMELKRKDEELAQLLRNRAPNSTTVLYQ
jgi:hypothetical protein